MLKNWPKFCDTFNVLVPFCHTKSKIKLECYKINRVNSKDLKLKDIWELGNLRNAATRLPAKKKKILIMMEQN